MLRPDQIKVHFKNGSSSVYPELNKTAIVRLLSENILRIEHYKPIYEKELTPVFEKESPVFEKEKKRGRPKKII